MSREWLIQNKVLTWKQFKEQVEAQGVTDDMHVEWIDTGTYPTNVSIGLGMGDDEGIFTIAG